MDESEMRDLLVEYGDYPIFGIMNLISDFAEEHQDIMANGSDAIYHNEDAEKDALELVCNIYDLISKGDF